MNTIRKNIAILEPSAILYDGLSNLLLRSANRYTVHKVEDFYELELLRVKVDISIVLINPNMIQNRHADFIKLKQTQPDISWIGVYYSFFDQACMTSLDDTFSITESKELLLKKIELCQAKNNAQEPREVQSALSERESGVLILLIDGFSNKEVADKLNISVHTVITHRKNIVEKTGIKSLSGLTIYAISKNIIQID